LLKTAVPARTCWWLLAFFLTVTCVDLAAQQMPKEDYIRYVPLEYPRIVRQTDASRRFQLLGDPSAPGYRDVDPVDGIDDARGRVLQALGERFAPYLVQNTTSVPMDHRRFMDRAQTWPLYVDTWDLTRQPELVGEDRIDLVRLERDPCPNAQGAAASAVDDCRLLALLDEFDPDDPSHARAGTDARAPERDLFKVLYFNFPGHDDSSWNEEYTNAHSNTLAERYRDFVKTFVHPFIHEVTSNVDGSVSYELVLQYWFFYPTNDGGNNHEGDWEHLGVVVTPMSRVGQPLAAEDILGMLDGSALGDSADPLVIGRLDYYIHNHVMQLDLSQPNVYLPRAEWEAQVAAATEQVSGEKWMWRQLRRRAWVDEAETVVNTHPFGYIGADNKGTDQLLAMPGGKNRDSHATYPFAGLYKDIGPAGASEQVTSWVDFRAYLNDPDVLKKQPYGRGWIQRLDEAGRVEIVPDWERIQSLLRTDPAVRKRWSWLLLPLRWGYPATPSPFAGVVAHAETGNLAVVGPSYSSGWNKAGASGGFTPFAPHRFSGFFALGWQDTFVNDWGFLNATLPTLTILPPFDIVFRVLLAPVRVVAGRHESTFFHTERIPFRFIGLVGGIGDESIPSEFTALYANTEQLLQILQRIEEADSTLTSPLGEEFSREGRSVFGGISLFVGKSFVSENLVKHVTGVVGERIALAGQTEPFVTEADLDLWEYAGSLRYSLATDRMQPFGRAGWGWSWYRLRNVSTQGEPLPTPDSPWVNNFTWHFGFGLEFLPIKGTGRGFGGLDAGVRGEMVWYRHRLGADQIADPIILAAGQVESGSVTRRQLSLAITLSF
jgi:hypothetical protein